MSVELRPITGDDIAEICELHQTAQRFDGVPQVMQLQEMEEELDDEAVVRATDTRAAWQGDRIVGYVYTVHLPSEVREERCYIGGVVHPDARGQGIGTALVQWGIARGSEQLRSSGHSLPRYLRVEVPDYIASAHQLFEDLGMTVVRYGEELLRPLTDLAELPTLDGVSIVPWDEDRDEEMRLSKNEAFEDHWGSTPSTPERWHQMVTSWDSRLDLSFMALDTTTGEVAGQCFNCRYESDDAVTGRRDALIASLGVRRPYRGRGVASALIAHSLHAFMAAGCTHAMIGVDTENPTGAARLYRALGFEPLHRSMTHQLEVV